MGVQTVGARTVSLAARVPRLGPITDRFGSRRAAQRTADLLDGIVDGELAFVRALPMHLRSRPAEVLALVATLAQEYRRRARGWIGHRELRRRVERAVAEIDRIVDEPRRAGV